MSPEIHSGGTTSFQLLKPLWAKPERENSKQEQPSVGFWSGHVGQGMLRCRQAWHMPLMELLTLTGLLFVPPPQLYLWAGKVGAHPSSISELARLVLGQHETLLWGDLLPVLVVWWEHANGCSACCKELVPLSAAGRTCSTMTILAWGGSTLYNRWF